MKYAALFLMGAIGLSSTSYESVARKAAQKYGLNPNVFVRQIRQESGFNPRAVSPAGARGIAQIMPATARGWGVNPDDPVASLDAAAKNMARYVRQYGSYRDALVAYNAGPGAVGKPLYAETSGYVSKILGANGEPPTRVTKSRTTTRTTYDDSARRAAVAQWLLSSSRDPLDLAMGLPAVEKRTATSTSSAGSTSGADSYTSRANAIDARRLPYKWGGGHAGKVDAYDAQPLDCSGAVSAVLGIDPRVASQFKSIGSPGRAPGGRGVTIYAKDDHVLMEIDGKLFGTSRSNPGGGAGWIKRSEIPAGYLRGFVARHLARS